MIKKIILIIVIILIMSNVSLAQFTLDSESFNDQNKIETPTEPITKTSWEGRDLGVGEEVSLVSPTEKDKFEVTFVAKDAKGKQGGIIIEETDGRKVYTLRQEGDIVIKDSKGREINNLGGLGEGTKFEVDPKTGRVLFLEGKVTKKGTFLFNGLSQDLLPGNTISYAKNEEEKFELYVTTGGTNQEKFYLDEKTAVQGTFQATYDETGNLESFEASPESTIYRTLNPPGRETLTLEAKTNDATKVLLGKGMAVQDYNSQSNVLYLQNGDGVLASKGIDLSIYDAKDELIQRIDTSNNGNVELSLGPLGNDNLIYHSGKILVDRNGQKITYDGANPSVTSLASGESYKSPVTAQDGIQTTNSGILLIYDEKNDYSVKFDKEGIIFEEGSSDPEKSKISQRVYDVASTVDYLQKTPQAAEEVKRIGELIAKVHPGARVISELGGIISEARTRAESFIALDEKGERIETQTGAPAPTIIGDLSLEEIQAQEEKVSEASEALAILGNFERGDPSAIGSLKAIKLEDSLVPTESQKRIKEYQEYLALEDQGNQIFKTSVLNQLQQAASTDDADKQDGLYTQARINMLIACRDAKSQCSYYDEQELNRLIQGRKTQRETAFEAEANKVLAIEDPEKNLEGVIALTKRLEEDSDLSSSSSAGRKLSSSKELLAKRIALVAVEDPEKAIVLVQRASSQGVNLEAIQVHGKSLSEFIISIPIPTPAAAPAAAPTPSPTAPPTPAPTPSPTPTPAPTPSPTAPPTPAPTPTPTPSPTAPPTPVPVQATGYESDIESVSNGLRVISEAEKSGDITLFRAAVIGTYDTITKSGPSEEARNGFVEYEKGEIEEFYYGGYRAFLETYTLEQRRLQLSADVDRVKYLFEKGELNKDQARDILNYYDKIAENLGIQDRDSLFPKTFFGLGDYSLKSFCSPKDCPSRYEGSE